MSDLAARFSLLAVGRDMARVIVRRPMPILGLMLIRGLAIKIAELAITALFPTPIDVPEYFGQLLLVWLLTLPVSMIGTAGITMIVVRDLNGMRTETNHVVATELRSILPLAFLVFATVVGVGLGSLLLLVPGVILYVRWLVAVPSWVIEGGTLNTAVRRSETLTAGSRWPLALYALIQFAPFLGFATCILALGGWSWIDALGEPLPRFLLLVLEMIVCTLNAVGGAVCYAHLLRLKLAASQGRPAAA